MTETRAARGWRILIWGLVGLIVLLAGGLFLLTRPAVLEWALITLLEGAGYGPARLEVTEASFSRLALEQVAIGRGPLLSAGRIAADYRLTRLLSGRLDAAEIDALRVRAELDGTGFHIALPEAPKSKGGKPFDFTRLPPIALTDARLQLATPEGTVEFVVDGALEAKGPQRLEAAPALTVRRAEEPERSIAGTAEIVIDGRRAELALALDHPGDRPLFVDGTLDGLTLDLVSDPGTGLDATARLALAGLAFGPLDRGSARLDVTLKSPGGGFLPTRAPVTLSLKGEATDIGIAPTSWLAALQSLPPSTQAAFALDALRPFRDSLLGALKTLDAGAKIALGADIVGEPEGKGRRWTLTGALGLEGRPPVVLNSGTNTRREEVLRALKEDSVRYDPFELFIVGEDQQRFSARMADGEFDRGTLPNSSTNGIEVITNGDGLSVRLGVGMSLSGAGIPITKILVAGSTNAIQGSGNGPVRVGQFDLTNASLISDVWRADGLTLEAKQLSLSAHGAPEDFSGEVKIDVTADGPFFPWLDLDDAKLALNGSFARAGGRTSLHLGAGGDECGHLTARQIDFAEMRITPGADGLALCGGGDGVPFLAFAAGTDGAAQLDIAGRVPALAARIEGPSELEGLPAVSGLLPEGRFTLQYHPDTERWTLDLGTTGGRVKALPDIAELGPLEMTGRLEGEAGLITRGELDLASVTIRDAAKAPRFHAATAHGRAVVDESRARFAGSLEAQARRLAEVTATHDLVTGEGAADLDLVDLLFTPQGLQPQALVPALKGVVTEVAGRIDADAHLDWGPKGFASEGEVSVEGLEFVSRLAPVVGLDGTIAFSSLVPPLTKGVQTARIRRIETPILLENGEIAFALKGGSLVEFVRAEWPLAGGTIGLENAELSFASAGKPQEVVFAADGIDLAQFLPLLRLQGLSGTGTLDGRVPLVIEGGRGRIVDGRLTGRAPGGTLSYRSDVADVAAASGPQASLLFRALDNFRWDELALTLGGEVDGRLDVQLEIRGANPAVYNGYPFRIRVKTSGAFAELLRQGTVGFRLKDLIEAGEAE